ncbi:pyridoxal-phosphate dependent enzyme [Sphaerisporangium album]|uniref:Pyridoxal-phosphate dependent enzyme n=1 Tax=Sphaerisporangium album TaxID=509200 RepID=A0A367FTH6_9ACTN|nr:pyridoxal-phosphate dependent enzyme [Sphaerisporangium album]RCG33010.1 pyridoxal-phosphate dependent enzyme [Sphaerisporangium album]
MLTPYECRCGRSHLPTAGRWRCDCGGLLDLPLTPVRWPAPAEVPSLWRYLDGGDVPWREVSLGEGGTPLVEEDGALYLKVEYASPTGSFKDRGAVVLVALARALGATRLVADSSGNAGTAVAAYAARAGVPAEIFVPAGTSEKKLRQIRGHGAEVVVVEGSREDTAAAAIARVEETGAFYASHVYNPYFHEGTKTYSLEIFEQLGGVVPETLVLPAGNGTLVLGAHRGFAGLRAAGVIDRVPRIVAVQAERCAPLAAAWAAGAKEPEAVRPGGTIAEGIAIADPARGSRILEAVADTGGAFVTVGEEEIAEAHAALAARGLWVEPTGAVSYAAVRRLRAEGSPLVAEGPVVAPLCGSGLKASL